MIFFPSPSALNVSVFFPPILSLTPVLRSIIYFLNYTFFLLFLRCASIKFLPEIVRNGNIPKVSLITSCFFLRFFLRLLLFGLTSKHQTPNKMESAFHLTNEKKEIFFPFHLLFCIVFLLRLFVVVFAFFFGVTKKVGEQEESSIFRLQLQIKTAKRFTKLTKRKVFQFYQHFFPSGFNVSLEFFCLD